MGSPYQLSVARSWNQSLWAETFGQSSNVGDKWWKDLRLNSQCQMPSTQTPFVLVTQSFRLSIRTSAKEVSRCMAVGDFNVNRRHVLLVLFSFFFFFFVQLRKIVWNEFAGYWRQMFLYRHGLLTRCSRKKPTPLPQTYQEETRTGLERAGKSSLTFFTLRVFKHSPGSSYFFAYLL